VEELREHLGYGADKLANLADATDDQERAIAALLDQIAPAMFADTLQGRAVRAELVTELGKPKVDRAELERIRKAGLDLAETASKRAVDSVGDMADILTPEQRTELIDLWSRWSR
jgi:Spy/CpxP family protein refolding chaperone